MVMSRMTEYRLSPLMRPNLTRGWLVGVELFMSCSPMRVSEWATSSLPDTR